MSDTNRVKEVIHIQIGGCGINVGNEFWRTIAQEHGLSKTGQFLGNDIQMEYLGAFFRESAMGSHFIPHCITGDLEYNAINATLASDIGGLFDSRSYIVGRDVGASTNFAKGFYSFGEEVIDSLLNAIRTETEMCEHVNTYQIVHNLAGGTGSGLMSLLITHLYDLIPDKLVMTMTVFPDGCTSDVVSESYNTCLGMHRLIDFTGFNVCYENNSIANIASGLTDTVHFQAANYVAALSMSGLTSGYRFPGQLLITPEHFKSNLVPFPKVHFAGSSIAPMAKTEFLMYKSYGINSLCEDILHVPYFTFGQQDDKETKIIAGACIFRGIKSAAACERCTADYQVKKASKFVDWNPNCLVTSHVAVSGTRNETSATGVMNTTAIRFAFNGLMSKMKSSLDRKLFFHLYESEGCEQAEFVSAMENLQNLVDEYSSMENNTGDEKNTLE